MPRSILGKAAGLAVLLALVTLLPAPSAHGGSPFMGFAGTVAGNAGFAGFAGVTTSGFAGIMIAGFAGAGSDTTAVPQPSSLLLTVVGLGAAAWGVLRNRR